MQGSSSLPSLLARSSSSTACSTSSAATISCDPEPLACGRGDAARADAPPRLRPARAAASRGRANWRQPNKNSEAAARHSHTTSVNGSWRARWRRRATCSMAGLLLCAHRGRCLQRRWHRFDLYTSRPMQSGWDPVRLQGGRDLRAPRCSRLCRRSGVRGVSPRQRHRWSAARGPNGSLHKPRHSARMCD